MEISTQKNPGDEVLTALRDDLKLLPGPPLEGGSPTWTLHDPVCNAFYRIGRLEFEMLARWPRNRHQEVTVNQVVAAINDETTLEIQLEEVTFLQTFFANHLLLAPGTQASREALMLKTENKPNPLIWLIHNYIFFRIPLFRPDKFLSKTLPLVRIVTTKPFHYLFLASAVLGLILVSRQWQSFLHTFSYFFTFEGLIYFTLALSLVKIFHELGHAYTAKYYGVKVPVIGIAFILLLPMLYSDTTESWKLTDRKARMRIVSSGVQVELALALIATLLWCFAADGPFRSACVIVATVTWISSLFMNLNPFMRFDGYYLFSDYLDIPNLQTRAFQLGKWYLRKLILGLEAPCPEILPANKIRIMILYAYATWLYRLFLFTTIALVVYHMFFKVLGLILFLVEIIWFIILPITKELDVWWMHRSEVGFCNRNLLTSFFLLCCLIALVFLPWNSKIYTSALILPIDRQQIYPPFEAQLKKIHIKNGAKVSKGELLFTLTDDLLFKEIDLAEKKIATLEAQLKRQIANSELLAPHQIIQGKIAEALTKLTGYQKLKKRLKITAPIDGTFVDLPGNLNPGQWVNRTLMLGQLVNRDDLIIESYIKEELLSVVKPGNPGLFYADNLDAPPIKGKVARIEPLNQRVLPDPYLASVYGGDLPVSRSTNNELVSKTSLYRVTIDLLDQIEPLGRIVRGKLILKGKRLSFYDRVKNRVMAVLIRESGF